jgi:uncharacterized protein YjhX (UPF0386 family)
MTIGCSAVRNDGKWASRSLQILAMGAVIAALRDALNQCIEVECEAAERALSASVEEPTFVSLQGTQRQGG